MKFEFLFDMIDRILRISENDKKADMQLPGSISVFGLAMALVGFLFILLAAVSAVWSLLLLTFATFLASAFAFLCYKFQRIHIMSDTEFQYTNFLGRKKRYTFSDIYAIEVDQDSRTLYMRKGRIRIKSTAIMSERLKQLFNKELDRIHKANKSKKAIKSHIVDETNTKKEV